MMADDDKMDEGRKAALVKAGFAAGIGSAAIAAALLYASRSRAKKPKKPSGSPPPTD
ncbi:MAG: isopropylmalate isomerase [Sphingomicrobium sp.]